MLPQLFCFGFEGVEPSPWIREFLERGGGGAILFRRNLADVQQIVELNASLRALGPRPGPLLWVDQEGGPVQRLSQHATPIPPMRVLGQLNNKHLARKLGALVGRECRALGFSVNAAPVLDVDSCESNPIIGARSFSSDPERVAALAGAFVHGLHSSGVLACGKHFPGHGHTTVDSHLDLPRLAHDLTRLREVELIPFVRVMAEHSLGMLMTAHVLYEGVDPVHPATLSAALVQQLLRQELRFGGVVVTDDLEMHALADRYSPTEIVRLGFAAGVDLFLICKTEDVQREALAAAEQLVADGEIPPERVAASVQRLARARDFLRGVPPPTLEDARRWLRCDEHLAFVAELQAAVAKEPEAAAS
jgi:beta-N-acetylhexosaminidase